MKIAFSSSACPDWTLDRIIGEAAAVGYDAVELSGLQGEMHLPTAVPLANHPDEVARRFRDAGIQLVCLATDLSFHWRDRQTLADHCRRLREFLQLAGRLGCPFVRVFGNEIPRLDTRSRTVTRIADSLRDMAPIAAENRTCIVLENHGEFAGSRDLWLIVDAADHPAVRCCWNPCIGHCAGDRPSLALPRLSRKLALARIVDARFTKAGVFDSFVMPGEGEVGIEHCLNLLKGLTYDGCLVFDWPKSSDHALAEPQDVLAAALAALRTMIRKCDAAPALSAYKGDKNPARYAARTRT